MIRDYADSYVPRNSRRYRKKSASSTFAFPVSRFMWKTIGFMLLITLLVSITSTVWYGMQIQVALDQIGSASKINSQLADENRLLVVQRDLLLSPKHMEQAAGKIGLRPPAENQVRYP